ncbi:MAG TPA: tetratricopeptide repeat-containing sensor histidine kinase [Ohtaekwangia sp.]|uniref:ATP-binding protein n=1 Tax=Ohtaekwangia sp. TaxID=2066019 RepID=UPI002F94B196
MIRVLFGCLLLVSVFPLAAQQEPDASIAWYESFFQAGKRRPIEKELEQATAKLRQAQAQNDKPAEAKALKEIGLIHLTRAHTYEVALGLFIRSLAIEDSLDLKREQIFSNLALAEAFEAVENHIKSAERLKRAFAISEEFHDPHYYVLILNKLGRVNASLGETEEAFENYELVLKYEEPLDQPQVEAEALFNLGHLYTQQGKYTEALSHHKRALALRRAIHDRKNEAVSLNDIGELYHLMKNDAKALANHIVALEIRQELKDKQGIAESYNNIGVLYFGKKNYSRAIANLKLALDAGKGLQDQQQMRRSYEYLSYSYKELRDYKNALDSKEQYLVSNDFILNAENERELLEKENRYELGKSEAKIDKLETDRIQREKEIEAQKKFRNVLFVLIALSLVIVVLVTYLYIVKKRSNQVLQEANDKVQLQNVALQDLNATKDKFFSIISHDLRGPLNSLTSFSGLLINHTDSLSKEEIKMLAQDLDKSLKNLFALLENLLEWSRSQTGQIEFRSDKFDLATLLEENKELLKAQANNKKITIENTCHQEQPIYAHRNSVNTVVRNLISNAIKFTPEGGTITLGIKPQQDHVVVSIADNGVGMSKDIVAKLFRIDTKHTTKGTANEKGTGLGLILCKEFIEKNGGRIWVESEEGKGSVFLFTLPVSKN